MDRQASQHDRRPLIERAYAAGIRAVDPGEAMRGVLTRTGNGFAVGGEPFPVHGNLVVVAIGKAAAPMAAAAADILGEGIDAGLALTKDGHAAGTPSGFSIFEASHPVPDARGIEATTEILASVEGLGANDVVLALISGGGSALFEAPAGDLALADIQATTDQLLRAGAPIQHLNAVRSELSQVKGGGFRRAIGPARVVSLILSDVLGNPPGVIASGPTVPRQPDPATALQVLNEYHLLQAVPARVRHHLELGAIQDTLPDARHDLYRVIGDNAAFAQAVSGVLEDAGLSVGQVWVDREGEAREQARCWVDELERAGVDAIVGGGEMTVTVRGDGIGGRNTEFALAAAIELDRRGIDATLASLASDGQDGSIDAAGAIVDGETVPLLRSVGVEPNLALDSNDSGTALGAIGALVVPGPTGTNVNDVYIAIRGRGQAQET